MSVADSSHMIPFNQPSRSPHEHIWLRRSQWRTVASLVLLLGAVVVLLALAAGFWWASRPGAVATVTVPAAPPPLPVATETIPASSPSVVELYPAAVVRAEPVRSIVRSPGGTVTAVTAHAGASVQTDQPLVRLVQRVPAPRSAAAAASAARREGGKVAAAAKLSGRVSSPPPARGSSGLALALESARRRMEADRLRQRLAQVQADIERLRPAAERPGAGASPSQRALREAYAKVERAQEAFAGAAHRRRETDRQYGARATSRFRFHLARSAELLAQVHLREAEEEANDARQRLAQAEPRVDTSAADQAALRIERLQVEARQIESRLARLREQVAGFRQRLEPLRPAPQRASEPRPASAVQLRPLVARAPRSGTVAAVRVKVGEVAPAGAPLLQIARPGRAYLRARVGQEALRSFRPGARVAVRRRDGSTFTGRVARVQRGPGGSALVVVIPPPGARLGEGLTLVPPVPHPAERTVPAAALVGANKEAAVWIARPAPGGSGGWVARRQAVRTGPARAGRVAIAAGLQPGDRVIVAGAHDLRDSQPVSPVEIGHLK